MATNGNANAVPFIRNSNLFRKRIMDSLVCWYDIGKQQCTNQSMAANPVLTDLSGNGHDITCHNFAWGGMSGIGGYPDNLRNYKIVDYDGFVTEVVNDHKFTINGNIGLNIYNVLINTSDYSAKRGSLYAKGIPDGLFFAYQINGSTSNPDGGILIKNGLNEFELNPDENSNFMKIQIRNVTGEIIENTNIEVEFLPFYKGALVTDGVDDYCYMKGLPILTKEKGYTVIAKRKLFYKEKTFQALASTNAFILERQEQNSVKCTYNFGSVNVVNTYPENITYQTSKSFNGTSLNVGGKTGNDSLKIFAHAEDYTSIALYSLLLFDRDLTIAEIEWVKYNLIEGDIEL